MMWPHNLIGSIRTGRRTADGGRRAGTSCLMRMHHAYHAFNYDIDTTNCHALVLFTTCTIGITAPHLRQHTNQSWSRCRREKAALLWALTCNCPSQRPIPPKRPTHSSITTGSTHLELVMKENEAEALPCSLAFSSCSLWPALHSCWRINLTSSLIIPSPTPHLLRWIHPKISFQA